MYQIVLHRLLPSYPQEPRLLHRRTIFAKNVKSEKIIVWLNISNCFKQLTICTSCILFCFSKKTQLFHFSNKVFSLVVHWGMKVMGMTKKKRIYDQKVTLTEEPKSLDSYSCSPLFSVFQKLNF